LYFGLRNSWTCEYSDNCLSRGNGAITYSYTVAISHTSKAYGPILRWYKTKCSLFQKGKTNNVNDFFGINKPN
jgi:hypothetical protein